jgi:hypothetical protein
MHEQILNVVAIVDFVFACRNAINAKPQQQMNTKTDENALQTRQKRSTNATNQENRLNHNENSRHVTEITLPSQLQCETHSVRTKQVAEPKPREYSHENIN